LTSKIDIEKFLEGVTGDKNVYLEFVALAMGRDRILTDERLQKAFDIFKTEMQGIEVLDKQKISCLTTHKDRVDSHNM